ncbi:MAG: hypothetical protein BGO12_19900 [Verrucomicrobia bacterium 61-8]|nr:MAG: hypothetical protein BGO12_19900 [Verrucomicrobia bacterium 61-8]
MGPLIPILLGVSGAVAWFGLDQFKPLFIGLGLMILVAASWVAMRKQNRCCATPNRKRSVQTVAMIFGIGIGFYLLLQYTLVPAIASVASSRLATAHQSAGNIRPVAGKVVQLRINGMTCAGCAIGIEHALLDIQGVLSAKVNWLTGIGTVTIDPGKVHPEDIVNAKIQGQYTLRLENSSAGKQDR